MSDDAAAARPAPPVRPLEGLTVVSIEQYGAAPFGTMYLADLGADVIKIENHKTGGEMGRHVLPYAEDGDSLFYQTFNCNKRCLALDLKKPRGREILERLAGRADALINNLRGDLPGTLELDYASLGAVNPRLVCVHLSAYGRDNERAAWPGLDYVMQAEAGYLSMTGEPDSVPTRFGLSVVDFMGGLTAALALVSGVMRARVTGQGMDLDTPLYDVAMNNLSYPATWHLNEGFEPKRVARSGHPSLVPSELYRTADGWIFVMANKANFWPALCRAMERPQWIDDPPDAGLRGALREPGRSRAPAGGGVPDAHHRGVAGAARRRPPLRAGQRRGGRARERLRRAETYRAGGAAPGAGRDAHGSSADHGGRRGHAAQRGTRARRRYRRDPRRARLPT